ncbi:Na+/H+ antiporter family protein [Aliivibrio sp. S4TY2]|uniref:Na+/H+ antiporter family protein n=1 Tax=unclassified Aliivibrio TaxID=2645654 RepID=UPI002379ECF7|nr:MULTISPECIES: Na+/H+ antiporter family protein [unclassified Aliivibrio]MDD9156590.1 Na+/H+ antiporter family protein [Aliivibrio sp. S4TY2]MDD9159973.1 Na+/H+ antiporter family protein [Aliivibrio sp. S4TY1]MDD9164195.1 Na+/H+ antiporter family protein [Aliivibrio sp. S4MY2]MDD9168297.1 Na+/H+ antiporter family protein [Aliivibrio sp. S4MY4]MDD9184633.1 Na+/H+ antiporter family protein [Aliivibrio sp. S4MY3]
MNPIILSVSVMLILALLRVNVVVALTFSALIGGLVGGLSLSETISAFEGGLGGGATIALSYAMLGAFAVAISKSGVTDLLAHSVIKRINAKDNLHAATGVKYLLLCLILLITISSQNVVPVHIAFIPILIPPLIQVFNKLKLDRRLIACVLTFGLVTPYMILPVGFGGIFLNNILLKNLHDNNLDVIASQVPLAMALPALGMVTGLLIAVFISYRKPRTYADVDNTTMKATNTAPTFNKRHIQISIVAIIAALSVQLATGSMIVGALAGFMVFTFGGVIAWKETQDVFTRGVHMMAMIGFIMISAAGFAAVMKATGGVEILVESLSTSIGDNKPLAALLMLVVGLLVTMGIGSSFSTIPIIATIYVPLAVAFGFSPMATIALVGTAAALGDAGSPASDSTLGPTSGLNADGQHEHVWETVVPTFLHYNLPLIAFGWIAAMVL